MLQNQLFVSIPRTSRQWKDVTRSNTCRWKMVTRYKTRQWKMVTRYKTRQWKMVTRYILVIWAQLPLIPFSFKNKTIFQIKIDNLGYVDSESEEDDSSEDNQFNAEDIPDMERLFLNPYRWDIFYLYVWCIYVFVLVMTQSAQAPQTRLSQLQMEHVRKSKRSQQSVTAQNALSLQICAAVTSSWHLNRTVIT